MKEERTLNEREKNMEWSRNGHWMKEKWILNKGTLNTKKQIWNEGGTNIKLKKHKYGMKEKWTWNEREMNMEWRRTSVEWKRNKYEMKEKRTLNEREFYMEWSRKEMLKEHENKWKIYQPWTQKGIYKQ